MTKSRYVRQFAWCLCLLLIPAMVPAQTDQGTNEYEPSVGQNGKDVIWVPTAQVLVDKMLDLAQVGRGDYLIDLGSGDGRTVISAAKRGAYARGIEYNPDMVALSKRNAATEGVADRAEFAEADLFETDLSRATVITMFLLPDINLRLRQRILGLKPGTRIVSNSFDMGEWTPDQSASVHEGCTVYCTAFLWIVPAKVEGRWQLREGELVLDQSFQTVTGALVFRGARTALTKGRLAGDRISFAAGNALYTGQVHGDTMEGTASAGGNTRAWRAVKKSDVVPAAG